MNRDLLHISLTGRAEPRLCALCLPSDAMAGVRLLFITDLHFRGGTRQESALDRLIGQVQALCPDLILWGGDFAEGDAHKPLFRRLSALKPRLGMLGVMGNNDRECYRDSLLRLHEDAASAGIQMLVNQSKRITRPGGSLLVVGPDEPKYGAPDLSLLDQPKQDGEFRILLEHSPLALDALPVDPKIAPDLILCGHTHGGQLRLGPFSIYSLGYERTKGLSNFYLSGQHQLGPSTLLVSNGIGTSVAPLRIGAPPEMHIVTFSSEKKRDIALGRS